LVAQRADNGDLVGALNLKSLSFDNFGYDLHQQQTYIDDENPVLPPLQLLGELTTLEHLSIDNNSLSSDLTQTHSAYNLGFIANNGIGELDQLRFLSIDNSNNSELDDIALLKGLKQLEVLSLRSNSIVDVGLLAGLAQLEFLDLSNNAITDIEALFG